MGLKEVVRRIAKEMESDAAMEGYTFSRLDVTKVKNILSGFARRFLDCVDAAEEPVVRTSITPVAVADCASLLRGRNPADVIGPGLVPREGTEERRVYQSAQDAAERLARGFGSGQQDADCHWELEGGPFDACSHPCSSQMPEGARTLVGDQAVYQRRGRVLVYDEESTKVEQLKRKKGGK